MRGFSSAAGARVRQSHADAVLWYPLSEDASSFPSHGTSTDALTAAGSYSPAMSGPLGKCLALQSDGGLSGADSVGLGSGDFTIWAWFIPPETGQPRWVWGKVRTTDSANICGIYIEGLDVNAYALAPTLRTVTSPIQHRPIAGIPNLVTVVYNKNAGKLYLFMNGLYAADGAASGAIQWVTETPGQTSWIVGSSAYTDGYTGRVLECGADSTAWNGAKIEEMYRRGMGWP